MFMLHESRSLILEDHILKEIRKHPTDEPPVFVMIIYHLQVSNGRMYYSGTPLIRTPLLQYFDTFCCPKCHVCVLYNP